MNQTVKETDVYLVIERNDCGFFDCIRFSNRNDMAAYLSDVNILICDQLVCANLNELRENYGFWPFDTGDCFFGFNCMRDFIESVMPYYGSKEYNALFRFNDDYWKDEN